MNANAPRMNTEIDSTIDRALSALRDAEPRSGLNGRILASLEHRNATPQPLRPHFSVHLALWAATSAAVLAIASLIILHRPGAPSSTRVPRQDGVAMTVLPTTRIQPQTRVPHVSALRRGIESPHPSMERTNCSNRPHSGCPIHDDGTSVGMSGPAQTSDLDAQALADLHAPSHPAPPLPLTPEEKLFRRMLQYRNSTQLAELDPAVRAKRNADESAAFKAFFPDPPPLKQPLGDTE